MSQRTEADDDGGSSASGASGASSDSSPRAAPCPVPRASAGSPRLVQHKRATRVGKRRRPSGDLLRKHKGDGERAWQARIKKWIQGNSKPGDFDVFDDAVYVQQFSELHVRLQDALRGTCQRKFVLNTVDDHSMRERLKGVGDRAEVLARVLELLPEHCFDGVRGDMIQWRPLALRLRVETGKRMSANFLKNMYNTRLRILPGATVANGARRRALWGEQGAVLLMEAAEDRLAASEGVFNARKVAKKRCRSAAAAAAGSPPAAAAPPTSAAAAPIVPMAEAVPMAEEQVDDEPADEEQAEAPIVPMAEAPMADVPMAEAPMAEEEPAAAPAPAAAAPAAAPAADHVAAPLAPSWSQSVVVAAMDATPGDCGPGSPQVELDLMDFINDLAALAFGVVA